MKIFFKVQKDKMSLADDNQEESVNTDCSPRPIEDSVSSEDLLTMEDLGSLNDKDFRNIEESVTGEVTGFNDDLEGSEEQINSHLTKNERALLQSCVDDAAFQRKSGKIKWEDIEAKFTEMADNVNVFCRSKKRLRSSSKSFKEVAKKRIVLSTPLLELSTPLSPPMLSTPTTVVNSNATNDPLILWPSIVVEGNSINTSHINLSTVVQVASTSSRTKRVDNLDELERLFVQDFGKKCLTLKKTVDSSKLLSAYLKQFPSFFRDASTLKNALFVDT